MAAHRGGWLAGLALVGTVLSASANAQAGPLDIYNPLGFYVGAGLGRATLNETEFDQFNGYFRHLDGEPLGWNAVIGIRPLPILGAEAEYLDFGSKEFLGDHTHDRAGAIFAVGYLPLPIPFMEPFAKLGWAQVWQHDTDSDASQTTRPSGAAYGGGLQFNFQQLGVRAQYERISGSRSFGGWNNPSLLSLGVNWTF